MLPTSLNTISEPTVDLDSEKELSAEIQNNKIAANYRSELGNMTQNHSLASNADKPGILNVFNKVLKGFLEFSKGLRSDFINKEA